MLRKMLMLGVPIARAEYAIVIPIACDMPLCACVRGHVWWGVILLFIPLMWVTSRRFFGIMNSQLWAVPYSLAMVSPSIVLYYRPNFNIILAFAGIVAIQLPAMLWRSPDISTLVAGGPGPITKN